MAGWRLEIRWQRIGEFDGGTGRENWWGALMGELAGELAGENWQKNWRGRTDWRIAGRIGGYRRKDTSEKRRI